MLNLFPIQFLALFAYALLRIVTGIIYITLAHRHFQSFSNLAPKIQWPLITDGRIILTLIIISESLIGGLFIIGLATQAAAIASIGLCFKLLIWHNRFPADSIPNRLTYVLLLAISVSLLITGAGIIAFDLPI
jgi:uncharacterized membrane protein YphA (DoxX/SURF4 family)